MKIKNLNLGTVLSREQSKLTRGGTPAIYDVFTYCPVGVSCNTTNAPNFWASDYPSGQGVVAILSGVCACIEGTKLSYVPPTNMC